MHRIQVTNVKFVAFLLLSGFCRIKQFQGENVNEINAIC